MATLRWCRDHVLRHGFRDPDPGVETLSDDVDKLALRDQNEVHVGIASEIFEDNRPEHYARRTDRGVDPQRSSRGIAMGC